MSDKRKVLFVCHGNICRFFENVEKQAFFKRKTEDFVPRKIKNEGGMTENGALGTDLLRSDPSASFLFRRIEKIGYRIFLRISAKKFNIWLTD